MAGSGFEAGASAAGLTPGSLGVVLLGGAGPSLCKGLSDLDDLYHTYIYIYLSMYNIKIDK